MATASTSLGDSSAIASLVNNPLVELLKVFRLQNPNATSEEFALHARHTLGFAEFNIGCFTVDGWKRLMQLESSPLLDFFASVHPDFRDYQLDMLLEQWHRLVVEAGTDWNPDVISRYAEKLSSYFNNHQDYKCKQCITKHDVVFIYKRFGIVPSRDDFHSASKLMVTCIEWVSRTFERLFERFSSPGHIPFVSVNACRLCAINQSTLLLELTTVCPITQQKLEQKPHIVMLCNDCSKFIRHFLLRCPCCSRKLCKAKQKNL